MNPAHHVLAVAKNLRQAVLAALEHDAATVAQATAYAAVFALFPALVVAAALVPLLPDTVPFQAQMALFFDRVLPSSVEPMLRSYFEESNNNPHTVNAVLGSVFVSVSGAATVMSTLMEGFRRAHELPLTPGSFWPRRMRALALVPLSLIPMALASALVVFGHFFSVWIASMMPLSLQQPVYVISFLARWTIALAGSTGIIAVVYHLGTDLSTGIRAHIDPLLREPWMMLRKDWSWRASLPGATVATLLWFVSTVIFGWYVTRFADYGRVYGSLGAGIALMIWLYLIALSILIGSEFNAQLRLPNRDKRTAEFLWKLPMLRRLGHRFDR